jgi:hypothetical protein
VFWLERNKRVFTSSTPSKAANLYFLILHLFKFWTGTSSMLEHVFTRDMDRVTPFSAPSAPLQAIGISLQGGVHFVPMLGDDEDLLDY